MDLAKAQSLRDELLVRLSLRPTPGFGRALSMGRRPVSDFTLGKPVALGIALGVRPNDYKVAIRLQGDRSALEGLVGEIAEACRGEVDIREIGPVYLQSMYPLRSRSRPLLIGGSVSLDAGLTGTAGLITYSKDRSKRFLLSNNHVLADHDDATPGDSVLQPGILDGGAAICRIGSFFKSIPVSATAVNYADAAIAELDPTISDHGNNVLSWGRINGVQSSPMLGTSAIKLGRTTGLTFGTVSTIGMNNLTVGWKTGVVMFDNCIEITGKAGAFSDSGDSGSVIFDNAGRAFGLLFAGSTHQGTKITYANELTGVMAALDLTL